MEIYPQNFIQNEKTQALSNLCYYLDLQVRSITSVMYAFTLLFLCNVVRENLVKISRNLGFCPDKQVLQYFKASHPRSSQ